MLIGQAIRFDLVTRHLPQPPARLMEVGCGGGLMAVELTRRGYRVEACDLPANAPPALSELNVLYHCMSGANLTGIPDNSFDAAVSWDVLEHVPPEQREALLAEMFRVTKTRGRVIISAFFRRTFGFRATGATFLLRRGQLPSWYLEHITIPSPTIDGTLRTISKYGSVKLVQPYRSVFSELALVLQPDRPKAIWLGHKIAPFIQKLDVLGSKSSCLFVIEKA